MRSIYLSEVIWLTIIEGNGAYWLVFVNDPGEWSSQINIFGSSICMLALYWIHSFWHVGIFQFHGTTDEWFFIITIKYWLFYSISIIYLPRVKLLEILLFNTNHSIQHSGFICTQSNGSKFCYAILIIQFRFRFKNGYLTLTIEFFYTVKRSKGSISNNSNQHKSVDCTQF